MLRSCRQGASKLELSLLQADMKWIQDSVCNPLHISMKVSNSLFNAHRFQVMSGRVLPRLILDASPTEGHNHNVTFIIVVVNFSPLFPLLGLET